MPTAASSVEPGEPAASAASVPLSACSLPAARAPQQLQQPPTARTELLNKPTLFDARGGGRAPLAEQRPPLLVCMMWAGAAARRASLERV